MILICHVLQILWSIEHCISSVKFYCNIKKKQGTEATIWGCSSEERFFIISQNLQENTTLLKSRLWCRRFPVSFAKLLRTPFLCNTSGGCLCQTKLGQNEKKSIKLFLTSVAKVLFLGLLDSMIRFFSCFLISLKSFCDSWGNSNTKWFVLDIMFRVRCGKSSLY